MPIYAYRCEQCDHRLELLQKVGDAPPAACPECGRPGLRKQLTAAGFRLKGGGWYETDFKRGGQRNVAGEREAAAKPKDGEPKPGGAQPKDGDKKPSGAQPKGGAGGKPAAAPAASAAAD